MRARVAVTLVAFALASAQNAGAGESVSTHSVSRAETVTPGQRLEITLDTGAGIKITGWDRSEVNVSTGWREAECPDAVVTLTKTADGAELETHYDRSTGDTHSCSLMIEVHVPKRFDVHLRSSGGSIDLADLNGTFDGRTGGGSLSLQRLKGRATLTTGGGSIQVRDSDLEGKVSTGGGTVNFQNVNGSLTGSSGSMQHTVHGHSRVI